MKRFIMIFIVLFLVSCTTPVTPTEDPKLETEINYPITINEFLHEPPRSEEIKHIIEVTENEILYLELEDRSSDGLIEVDYLYPPQALSLNRFDLRTKEATVVRDLVEEDLIYLESFEFEDDKYSVVVDLNNIKKMLIKNWLSENPEIIKVDDERYYFDEVVIADNQMYFVHHDYLNSHYEIVNQDQEVIYESSDYIAKIGNPIFYDSTHQQILFIKDNEIVKTSTGLSTIYQAFIYNDSLYYIKESLKIFRYDLETKITNEVSNDNNVYFWSLINQNHIGIDQEYKLGQYKITDFKIQLVKTIEEDVVSKYEIFNDEFIVITKPEEVILNRLDNVLKPIK